MNNLVERDEILLNGWNQDELSEEEKDLIALILMTEIGKIGPYPSMSSYVVEVRLDNVMNNLRYPNERVFRNHGLAPKDFKTWKYRGIHLHTFEEREEESDNEGTTVGTVDPNWAIVSRHSLDNIQARAQRAKVRVDRGDYDVISDD